MLDLIPGLISIPQSRFRARYLQEHPSKASSEGLQFMGWSQDSSLLLAIHNALLALLGGKKAKKAFLEPPKAQRTRLFARSIAEFDIGKFMSLLGGRR